MEHATIRPETEFAIICLTMKLIQSRKLEIISGAKGFEKSIEGF